MRLSRCWFAMKLYARAPQNINKVPFKTSMPLRLKNSVSGKSDRSGEIPCLQEITMLFASMKTHDFNEAQLKNEINNLKTANVVHLNKKLKEKEKLQGVPQTGRDLNYKQLNKYLKMFPNP